MYVGDTPESPVEDPTSPKEDSESEVDSEMLFGPNTSPQSASRPIEHFATASTSDEEFWGALFVPKQPPPVVSLSQHFGCGRKHEGRTALCAVPPSLAPPPSPRTQLRDMVAGLQKEVSEACGRFLERADKVLAEVRQPTPAPVPRPLKRGPVEVPELSPHDIGKGLLKLVGKRHLGALFGKAVSKPDFPLDAHQVKAWMNLHHHTLTDAGENYEIRNCVRNNHQSNARYFPLTCRHLDSDCNKPRHASRET